MVEILALDAQGTPRAWIPLKKAISYHATDSVAWEYGDEEFVYRGGYQNGVQSKIYTKSIIAIKSEGDFALAKLQRSVILTNKTLFGRDQNICAYCGRTFTAKHLSRDHIQPRSRGGMDHWMNVVTACKDCNCDKDDRLLSECKMELLYLPYIPNFAEKLLLERHNILGDQMAFLKQRLPKNSRLL